MAKQNKKAIHEADSKGNLKFSSPLDMQYKGPVDEASDLDRQMTVEQMDAMQAKYRNEMLGEVVRGQVDDWREGFEKEYGWIAPNNVIGFYRAILQELYRMRVGK